MKQPPKPIAVVMLIPCKTCGFTGGYATQDERGTITHCAVCKTKQPGTTSKK